MKVIKCCAPHDAHALHHAAGVEGGRGGRSVSYLPVARTHRQTHTPIHTHIYLEGECQR